MERRRAWIAAVGILMAGLLYRTVTEAETVRNGFALEPASIPAAEILAGGPPRDGIPALDHPATLPAAQTDWADDDLVLGVVVGGEARAYPASELARAGGSVEERFRGRAVRIAYDSDRQLFDVDAPSEVEVVEGFWFAWAAFHPETSVYTAVIAPAQESL